MTVEELKAKMHAAQRICEEAIHLLQDENIQIDGIKIEKIEVTSKDSPYPMYNYRVHIETKIVS